MWVTSHRPSLVNADNPLLVFELVLVLLRTLGSDLRVGNGRSQVDVTVFFDAVRVLHAHAEDLKSSRRALSCFGAKALSTKQRAMWSSSLP